LLRRLVTAVGYWCRRGILGRSSWDYLKQYTGSDAYWDNMLAAQRGECRPPTPKPIPVRPRAHEPLTPEPGKV
jgi:hypothetical protein